MAKQIQLTQGKFALVDDEDFERINQWKWRALKHRNGKYYAVRWEGKRPFRKTVLMHRFIIDTPDDLDTDHRDGDGLNNQRYNLRNCLHIQNSANQKKHSNNTSGFKGVSYNKKSKTWYARIKVSGNSIHIGAFHDAEEAARAYDRAAREYFGEFASTNFPT